MYREKESEKLATLASGFQTNDIFTIIGKRYLFAEIRWSFFVVASFVVFFLWSLLVGWSVGRRLAGSLLFVKAIIGSCLKP